MSALPSYLRLSRLVSSLPSSRDHSDQPRSSRDGPATPIILHGDPATPNLLHGDPATCDPATRLPATCVPVNYDPAICKHSCGPELFPTDATADNLKILGSGDIARIGEIYNRLDEYTPKAATTEKPSVYVLTEIGAHDFRGPEPRKIEKYIIEYHQRTEDLLIATKKRKPRGGKKTRLKRERAKLHQLIRISDGDQRKLLKKKLFELR
ncbi:uncharacterized protein LOC119657560 [Hermetia illucens]|uniref:uncharacterized protein LOC119657560 n=1 Tax=Hermetia illucens TaxID=343691 RepID=UPI0018CC66A8|nr:uncharacterized protein LOC119657560 [Hermetia illucens]